MAALRLLFYTLVAAALAVFSSAAIYAVIWLFAGWLAVLGILTSLSHLLAIAWMLLPVFLFVGIMAWKADEL